MVFPAPELHDEATPDHPGYVYGMVLEFPAQTEISRPRARNARLCCDSGQIRNYQDLHNQRASAFFFFFGGSPCHVEEVGEHSP